MLCLPKLQEHQRAAKAAEERYRQELEAHAGAITALRQAEEAQDVSRRVQAGMYWVHF